MHWRIQGVGVGTPLFLADQCIWMGTYSWNPPFVLGWEPPFLKWLDPPLLPDPHCKPLIDPHEIYKIYTTMYNTRDRCKVIKGKPWFTGANPAILKRGVPNPGEKGGGRCSNYMSPFKCIDRPKKGGSNPRNPPLWIRAWFQQHYIPTNIYRQSYRSWIGLI